ncbi:tRNA pseudouridine(38-40) synthase TruA [Ruminiclostridium cellulolyticum]|uniref:tRNA pseudouridine synthase A n=1 Tax=Ruminiclostridium cellulolyticum (strain ATCC 35319 / DSM 5812 / JCM 6584 / H10) TaxID=394503 RepID=TRUA_RUMCH|nr:tRNA pseudouridine(38-40) synthase TruA [Ruminiclostridium cellulolyticum]B8I814.1 RecName: Full=tRNA pseudouridine synthase A; AltName: Full=tRNA pseudouridine(38-40) synthase; AltName: Full=tRNA pseudouridylate synthase I; AltName: Full=tRNA-uridine isomerase I [Ruminiclostridium cellulolyticum H10]ACL75171.1 tRNA pseudouridine synthase A [Ruminiclostridium cellulolyticum H10]
MRKIRLTIEYDGTNYHGWQIQKNAKTVQEVIQKALSKLLGEDVGVTGCSRTDVGVHAYGQVAHFLTDSKIPGDKFSYAINNLLPDDIVIKNSEEVPEEFHARYSAKGKKYRYLIYNSPHASAIMRNRSCHVRPELNVAEMQKAAGYFKGEHDFLAFQATGGQVRSTVREIYGMEVYVKEDNMISIEVSGNGFLYNMVRIIAGTLIYVGMGKLHESEIPGIIAGLDRTKAGKTAPAQGLYLVQIYY